MWNSVCRGPPLLGHADFMLEMYSRKGRGPREPSHCGGLIASSALQEAISQHGLRLNTETDARGDCGVDAILRNLERLKLDVSEGFLKVLHRRGRKVALEALRLKLLIWLKDNLDHEMMPQLAVRDWLVMDGDASCDAYLKRMRQPGEWVDCPMLYAASAILAVQLVCFLTNGDPQVVVASTISHLDDLPILLLANADNMHFWAVEPSDDIGAPILHPETSGHRRADDTDLLGEHYAGNLRAGEADLSGEHCGPDMPSNKRQGIFDMAAELMQWKPFDKPVSESRLLECCLQAESGHIASDALMVVKWREAIKLHQWEEIERSAGISRDEQYRIARNHLATYSHTAAQVQKTRKLCAKLCLAQIIKQLSAPCEKKGAKKKHNCLDLFRDKPKIVWRWRRFVWVSLLKCKRAGTTNL